MRFELLGTLRVGDHSGWRDVGGEKPRTVLAALLLNPGTVVPSSELIDVLWGGRPPASASDSLHNHVMRLRRMLGDRKSVV